jgi:uncharacterized protein (DUF983 family)
LPKGGCGNRTLPLRQNAKGLAIVSLIKRSTSHVADFIGNGMAKDTSKQIWSAMGRGALACCPNCGRAPLFRSYLKQVDVCAACNEPLKHIRADDGPAWLTILIVGHIVVGLALTVEIYAPLPVGASIALFCGLSLAMILWLLPRAKGVFIGAIWAMKAPGSEQV